MAADTFYDFVTFSLLKKMKIYYLIDFFGLIILSFVDMFFTKTFFVPFTHFLFDDLQYTVCSINMLVLWVVHISCGKCMHVASFIIFKAFCARTSLSSVFAR